jgi:hypothetical protein
LSAIRLAARGAGGLLLFDYVLGMDSYNLRLLRTLGPQASPGLGRLLDFAPHLESTRSPTLLFGRRRVRGGADQIEAGADGLIAELRRGAIGSR